MSAVRRIRLWIFAQCRGSAYLKHGNCQGCRRVSRSPVTGSLGSVARIQLAPVWLHVSSTQSTMSHAMRGKLLATICHPPASRAAAYFHLGSTALSVRSNQYCFAGYRGPKLWSGAKSAQTYLQQLYDSQKVEEPPHWQKQEHSLDGTDMLHRRNFSDIMAHADHVRKICVQRATLEPHLVTVIR